MKLKNVLMERMVNSMEHDPMEELHYEAHMAMTRAAQYLDNDQIWVLCYLSGLNSSDYISTYVEGEVA